MAPSLFLDTTPEGLLSQRPGVTEAEECRAWLRRCLSVGVTVYLPEIADYECRRELLRARKTAGVARLDRLKTAVQYLPLTTDAMLRAAGLWAESRQRGIVTAGDRAIDGDVILAAQALSLGFAPSELSRGYKRWAQAWRAYKEEKIQPAHLPMKRRENR